MAEFKLDNFNELLDEINTVVVKTNTSDDGTTKFDQKERNALRKRLLDALAADLDLIDIGENTGYIMEVPNEELGSIFIAINVQMKSPDLDIDEALSIYEQEKQEKAARAAEREAKKKRVPKLKDVEK